MDDLAHAGNLFTPPPFAPAAACPDGVNVKFVVEAGGRSTSPCASTSAAPGRPGRAVPARAPWPSRRPVVTEPTRLSPGFAATCAVADVPGGGHLVITERPDGEIEMTGPAVIVAEGEFDAEWLGTVPF